MNVALAFLKCELKFSGSTGSVESNFVGTSANGKSKHTDGQVGGSPFWLKRVAFDVSIVNPTAVSHSGAGACGESFLNPNAWTRAAEETKTNKYKLLCQQRGMDFVPIMNLHNQWGDGGAAPGAILEPTLDESGRGG